MNTINLSKDQKDSSKAGVQLAGNVKQPKKVYSYSEVSRMLSTKDKEGNYVVKSYDDAMEKFVSTGLGTRQFIKERWEIVKLIFRCFHSYNAGMPKSLIGQYQPVESGKDILAAIQKKYPKLIVE